MTQQQIVSTPTRALALVPPLAAQETGPTLTELVIRLEIDLKPERVQEPAALSTGSAAAESGGGFALALTVSQSQPVTIELSEPKVTFTFHGMAAAAADGGGLAAAA